MRWKSASKRFSVIALLNYSMGNWLWLLLDWLINRFIRPMRFVVITRCRYVGRRASHLLQWASLLWTASWLKMKALRRGNWKLFYFLKNEVDTQLRQQYLKRQFVSDVEISWICQDKHVEIRVNEFSELALCRQRYGVLLKFFSWHCCRTPRYYRSSQFCELCFSPKVKISFSQLAPQPSCCSSVTFSCWLVRTGVSTAGQVWCVVDSGALPMLT